MVDVKMPETCVKCETCEGASHHWTQETSEEFPEGWFSCAHCPARGDTCNACEGEGCALCHGEGVFVVGRSWIY